MLRLIDSTTSPCLVLDGTGVSDWLRCHQFWQFRHHAAAGGLVPAEDSINLVAGGAVHDALEVRYRHRGPVTEEVRKAMSAANHAKWAAANVVPDWRSEQYVETLLDAYLLAYPVEPFAMREVETPFARVLGQVDVGGRRYGVLYQGRRDLVVSYLGSNCGEWVMDHKTASSDSNWPVQWGQSLSQLGYCWSRQQFTGQPCEGFIMNILMWRKPTAKASQLPRFQFTRVPITVQAWQLDEWRESVLTYAKQIIESMQSGVWPKNPDSCLKYGARCGYWDACTSPLRTRERLLASGAYKRNDWSPLAEKPESGNEPA